MSTQAQALFAAAAFALLLVAIGSGATFWQQKARRGAAWWLAAGALLVVSLVLQATRPRHDLAAPLAALLALQWPIAMLTGVRRFFSRGAAMVPAWLDVVVVSVAALSVAGTSMAPFEFATPMQVYAGAMLLVTLHAAVAVARLEEFATTPALKALLAGILAAAATQIAWMAIAITGTPFPVAPAAVGIAASLATAALALLASPLTLAMQHEREIAHLRASQRKLRRLVDVDALTQLPNRRHFHTLAERAIQAAPELATVVVFDVDRLKRVNELLGHANGDEALRQIGTAMRETLRRRDVAGRLGGDEFGVVMPRTRAADAQTAIARINARIDDRQVAPRIARIALNVGITQMQAGEPLADALRRAEIALTVSRDETRRLDDQRVVITAEAAELRGTTAAPTRPSQAAALSPIPVGEVSLGVASR